MERTPKERVIDRLTVVRALIELKKPIAEPAKFGVFPEGSANSRWDQHDSLINYLLLTCFDVLGQEGDFVDFGKWLEAGRLVHEREEALGTIEQGLSPTQTTLALYRWYNKRYSVTRAFYRFIDSLPEAARNELLGSVLIARTSPIGEEELPRLRKDFLYQLRNGFTHAAEMSITVARMADASRMVIIDATSDEPRVSRAARMVYGDVEKEGTYHVADWPYVLYRTVAGAVGEPVPAFDPAYTMLVNFGDKIGVIGEAKSADLQDKETLSKIVAAMRVAVLGAKGEPTGIPEVGPHIAVLRTSDE